MTPQHIDIFYLVAVGMVVKKFFKEREREMAGKGVIYRYCNKQLHTLLILNLSAIIVLVNSRNTSRNSIHITYWGRLCSREERWFVLYLDKLVFNCPLCHALALLPEGKLFMLSEPQFSHMKSENIRIYVIKFSWKCHDLVDY